MIRDGARLRCVSVLNGKEPSMHRRNFVMGSMAAVAYARAVRGANDRLRVAIIGPGTQGTGLMKGFAQYAQECNAELVAVCDLWTRRRDEAAARVKAVSGREPRKLQRFDELMAMKDLDGIIIATPDHTQARSIGRSISEATRNAPCR
jgi:ornithine cyclodeaminase/alanine dehydrogenase-like protein (mu-crystallin family)